MTAWSEWRERQESGAWADTQGVHAVTAREADRRQRGKGGGEMEGSRVRPLGTEQRMGTQTANWVDYELSVGKAESY